MKSKVPQKGFTLVELSIVMMIIGLIIGGIIQGQRLMDNARYTATIAQTDAFRAAMSTFFDIYGQLPGDMNTAIGRLPKCGPPDGPNCQNGNGNGLIGSDPIGNEPLWYLEDQSLVTSERSQFWLHMQLASLIEGVILSQSGIVNWGETHPAAKIGQGGWQLTNASSPTDFGAYFFRLQSNVSGIPSGAPGSYAISPYDMAAIDRKADDGDPGGGSFRAIFPPAPLTGVCADATGEEYALSKQFDCLGFIEVGAGL